MKSIVAMVAVGGAVACANAIGVADGSAASGLGLQAAKRCSEHPRCCSLRGRTLAQNRHMRIVRRPLDAGAAELEGCVFDVGRIRKLGDSSQASTTTRTAKLEHIATTFAAVRTAYSNQYGAGEALSVTNVASGHHYDVVAWDDRIEAPLIEHPSVTTYFLNPRGQVAAAIVTVRRDSNGVETATRVQIVAYGVRGRRLVLDSGTPAEISPPSLHLSGSTARWTHAGQARTGTVPG
jgi:hypothetical protein